MADSLYETVGGRLKIQAAVDSFYQRVLADPSVSKFFQEADLSHLRARQSMFVSMVLGGRIVYTGKEIGAAHAQARKLGMDSTHFDTILKHFRGALEEIEVRAVHVEKIIALLESQRATVLGG